MVNNLLKIFKETTWFLHSGVAPKNASSRIKSNLEDMNHMTSKKFAMTMIAISVIAFMYFSSVACLFLFKSDPHVSALVSMYKDMIVAVASIAATLVGIQGLVDWKYNSNSDVNLKSNTENINETLTSNIKEDDYDISKFLL
jgi:hypothetical protein